MREDVLKIFTKDTIDMCKHDDEKYFLWKIQNGWDKKEIPYTKEYIDRVNYEVGVIVNMGFVDYMLIVADMIEWAKDNGVPTGPGRGSAGGSLVAYCQGITTIDPIKYHLYFERFLNPARACVAIIDTSELHEKDFIKNILPNIDIKIPEA